MTDLAAVVADPEAELRCGLLNAQDKLRFMHVLAVTCRMLLDFSDTGVTR